MVYTGSTDTPPLYIHRPVVYAGSTDISPVYTHRPMVYMSTLRYGLLSDTSSVYIHMSV